MDDKEKLNTDTTPYQTLENLVYDEPVPDHKSKYTRNIQQDDIYEGKFILYILNILFSVYILFFYCYCRLLGGELY